MSLTPRLLAGALLLAGLLAMLPLVLDPEQPLQAAAEPAATPAIVERGRVLALAGNCATCHTARGGPSYAGGRGLATPFGTVYAGNLTPDADTGLGRWTPAHFWRALHHGQGFDGRRLVPAFPYTEFTRITRTDSDALWAYLRTLPAVSQLGRQAGRQAGHPPGPQDLRWPYGTPLALATWRTLFFRAGEFQPDASQSADWNRGAYLVNGPGHCVACHGGRNALGATADAGFGGGLIPTRNWYAPAFTRAGEASVAAWAVDDIVALLQTGAAPRGRADFLATGPMAEVVMRSTQHLPLADLRAVAVYLKSLPQQPDPPPQPLREPARVALRVQQGQGLYRDHCAACHGTAGEGGQLPNGDWAAPPLAGNRLVAQEPAANLVRAIALGGFGASTQGRPRPFGMPPFAHVLTEDQMAAVATFLRRSWGAQASPVDVPDVARWRGGSDD
jgi:mono/diheme cytochrome c family protein